MVDPSISIIIVAAIAVFTSVTAPLILASRTERMHREDQLEVYRREDRVALEAKETSNRLIGQQQRHADEAAALAREIASQAADAASLAAQAVAAQDHKLDQINLQARRIHTLVNSDMTAARQSELDQTRAMVVVLSRVINFANVNEGTEPLPTDIEALAKAKLRVIELESILADRLMQLRQVEADTVAGEIVEDDKRKVNGV